MEKGFSLFFTAGLLIFPFTSQVYAAAGPQGWSGVPFSAMQYEYEKAQPKNKAVSQVFISPKGLRLVVVKSPEPGMDKMITIINFKPERTWMVFPKAKSYTLMEGGEHVEHEESAGGIFTNKPCQGFASSKKLGMQKFGGRNTEKWACNNQGKQKVALQYFDPKLHTVIREERDGRVVELRDIKPGKQANSLFQPPAGYKKQSMMQMMMGLSR